MCIFIFVCSIYSECAVAIYSEYMDAYLVFYTYAGCVCV